MVRARMRGDSIDCGSGHPSGPETLPLTPMEPPPLFATQSQYQYPRVEVSAAPDPTRPPRPGPLDRSRWRFAFEAAKTLIWLTVVGAAAFIAVS